MSICLRRVSARRVQPIVLALSLILLFAACSPQPPSAPAQQDGEAVREATIRRGDLRETVSVAARVEPVQRAGVSFTTPGEVAEVNIRQGQRVTAGDQLMALDVAQLELAILDAELAVELQQLALQALQEGPSNAEIASARASVQQAQARLDQVAQPVTDEAIRLAQANLQLAESDRAIAYQRWTDALNQHNQDGQHPDVIIAQKAAEAAELTVQVRVLELANAQEGASEGEVAASRAQVRQSQAVLSRLLEGPSEMDLELQRLAVEQAQLALVDAKAALDEVAVFAPFDGVVTAVNFRPGEQAVPGLPAVVIVDDSSFYLDVPVDELDIIRVREGQPAVVELDAFPGVELTGEVERIVPVGRELAGVTTFSVRVVLHPTDVPLREGMTATANIVVAELSDVLLVPNWAVRFDRTTGQAYATVRVDDQTVEEVAIELGVRGETDSEVRSGLEEGDVIVLSLERQGLGVPGFGGD